jgi:uroporphyrinogen decarboxylase
VDQDEANGMDGVETKPLLRVLAGERLDPPPWWLMRQAGRLLPEYRELRAKARDFVNLCLTPELAVEATLQPIRRFGMDAAILFSDILLIPYALGQRLSFPSDRPVLDSVANVEAVNALTRNQFMSRLEPVFEAARRCRAALPEATALIGFAGAPCTVATYMVEGRSTRDFQRVKAWSYGDPAGFTALMEVVTEATIAFLSAQIEAGVDVVQLFDTCAGVLPESSFERWIVEPTRRITAALKARFPACPVIGFPRGAGVLYERYAVATGIDALSLDTVVPLGFARDSLQPRLPVQGNLDPVLLAVGGSALSNGVAVLRRELGGGAYVFNLGHGVLPQTPPEHVTMLARLLAEPLAN